MALSVASQVTAPRQRASVRARNGTQPGARSQWSGPAPDRLPGHLMTPPVAATIEFVARADLHAVAPTIAPPRIRPTRPRLSSPVRTAPAYTPPVPSTASRPACSPPVAPSYTPPVALPPGPYTRRPTTRRAARNRSARTVTAPAAAVTAATDERQRQQWLAAAATRAAPAYLHPGASGALGPGACAGPHAACPGA